MAQVEELARLRAEVAQLRQAQRRAADALTGCEAVEATAAMAALEAGAKSGREDSTREGRVESPPPEAANCSESRLRAALTQQGTTSEDLRQAIGAVEALLEEARRELAAKERRERRSAFETLHLAMERGDEEALPEAVAEARRLGVDGEDIAKAEAKLKELVSQTAEQRAAKAAKELETKLKKEAFLFVKKNDGAGLEALLKELAAGVTWQDWKDHAGRTLWRCSQDLKAASVQAVLAPRLGHPVPVASPKDARAQASPGSKTAASDVARSPSPATSSDAPVGPSSDRAAKPAQGSAGNSGVPGLPLPRTPAAQADGDQKAAGSSAYTSSPQKSQELTEEEKLKARALRCVVQDDGEALAEVLQDLSTEVISSWQNRAGVDLLTLSEERGSAHAYSVLAKALGLVREMKRELYEERETVWVFAQGDVQPRRATVLEDTPAEADEVLLEFWDGDEAPALVERSRVRRMWS